MGERRLIGTPGKSQYAVAHGVVVCNHNVVVRKRLLQTARQHERKRIHAMDQYARAEHAPGLMCVLLEMAKEQAADGACSMDLAFH